MPVFLLRIAVSAHIELSVRTTHRCIVYDAVLTRTPVIRQHVEITRLVSSVQLLIDVKQGTKLEPEQNLNSLVAAAFIQKLQYFISSRHDFVRREVAKKTTGAATS